MQNKEIELNEWRKIRRKHIKNLNDVMKNETVDKEIIPLLLAINNYSEDCVTTSSCYGRIVLIKLRYIGDKSISSFYRKWHSPVDAEILWKEILGYNGSYPLWLVLQSTIIHIKCRTLEKAIELRNIGIQSGYKYSKILSISTKGYTVEISGTERMNLPVKIKNQILINKKFLNYFMKISLEMFQRIENKKNRFINFLKTKNLKIS